MVRRHRVRNSKDEVSTKRETIDPVDVDTKRKARKYYNFEIPVNDRIADQKKKEPLIDPSNKTELKKWLDNPELYDIQSIDDPIPKGLKLEIDGKGFAKFIELKKMDSMLLSSKLYNEPNTSKK